MSFMSINQRLLLIGIFILPFSIFGYVYESDTKGVPSFSNIKTEDANKIDLGSLNVIGTPKHNQKIIINNFNNTEVNNNQKNYNYINECAEYYEYPFDYSSYGYLTPICDYLYRRDSRFRESVIRKSINRETYYSYKSRENQVLDRNFSSYAMNMVNGMRMRGGRR